MNAESPSHISAASRITPAGANPSMPLTKPYVQDTLSSLSTSAEAAPALSNPELSSLQQKVTDTFLALLVEVFSAKAALQEEASTSRLIAHDGNPPKEEIAAKLQSLLKDLGQLELWTEATRLQIEKALAEAKTPESDSKTLPSLFSKFRKLIS